ncbi:hypothetical protein SARC_14016, partial [Sphaeroforma arctica JP610]
RILQYRRIDFLRQAVDDRENTVLDNIREVEQLSSIVAVMCGVQMSSVVENLGDIFRAAEVGRGTVVCHQVAFNDHYRGSEAKFSHHLNLNDLINVPQQEINPAIFHQEASVLT